MASCCIVIFHQYLALSWKRYVIRSQIREDTVEQSVSAREFNVKAYAAITWHNDPASLGLEPRLAVHLNQAARTATLPTAPPRQAFTITYKLRNLAIVTSNRSPNTTANLPVYDACDLWAMCKQRTFCTNLFMPTRSSWTWVSCEEKIAKIAIHNGYFIPLR